MQHQAFSSTRSPFALNNEALYQRWRDQKLATHPNSLQELLVEIKDPRSLSKNEYGALLDRIQRANMAIYVGNTDTNPAPEIPLALARQFGLEEMNKNWLADDNGLTSLTVVESGTRKNYIPYTNKLINWHTDGYYNAPDKQIHALNLHVVQRAAVGGENQLMDHEMAYLLLREKNPDFIRALMADDVMSIPAGTEPDGSPRPERSGPVFSLTHTGDLHMRYSARARNIRWSDDDGVGAAVEYLQQLLHDPDSSYIFSGLLEPGMGLISNNVLHNRAAFTDSEQHKRHYYRARYFKRLAQTGLRP